MIPLSIAGIIFLAFFTQAVSGFGSGLISVALLVLVLDLKTATPLVALVAFLAELAILLRYRHAFSPAAVMRLAAAAVVGSTIGVYVLSSANHTVILQALGVILIGYGVYALLNFRLPAIQNPRWAYGFGFVSGVFSGLYNIGGPPLIIYGTCRRWSPGEFRSNLQGIFIITTITALINHTLHGNITPQVWQNLIFAVPGMILGVAAGFTIDRYINPLVFRKIVFALLIVLGLNIVF